MDKGYEAMFHWRRYKDEKYGHQKIKCDYPLEKCQSNLNKNLTVQSRLRFSITSVILRFSNCIWLCPFGFTSMVSKHPWVHFLVSFPRQTFFPVLHDLFHLSISSNEPSLSVVMFSVESIYFQYDFHFYEQFTFFLQYFLCTLCTDMMCYIFLYLSNAHFSTLNLWLLHYIFLFHLHWSFNKIFSFYGSIFYV